MISVPLYAYMYEIIKDKTLVKLCHWPNTLNIICLLTLVEVFFHSHYKNYLSTDGMQSKVTLTFTINVGKQSLMTKFYIIKQMDSGCKYAFI